MTPNQANQANEKINEKVVYNNLKDNREIQKPIIQLGDLFRTAEIKKVFSKGGSTTWSYIFHTKAEVIHDTTPRYGIDYFKNRYNEILLRPTKQTLPENNQFLKELNLIQQKHQNKWD